MCSYSEALQFTICKGRIGICRRIGWEELGQMWGASKREDKNINYKDAEIEVYAGIRHVRPGSMRQVATLEISPTLNYRCLGRLSILLGNRYFQLALLLFAGSEISCSFCQSIKKDSIFMHLVA
jgi:hypothetical protein